MDLIFTLALVGMLWMCICFILSIKYINKITDDSYLTYKIKLITLKAGVLLVPIIIINIIIGLINIIIWFGCIILNINDIIHNRFFQDFLISMALTIVGSNFSGVFGLEIGLATSTLISPIMWIMEAINKKQIKDEESK